MHPCVRYHELRELRELGELARKLPRKVHAERPTELSFLRVREQEGLGERTTDLVESDCRVVPHQPTDSVSGNNSD